MRRDILHSIILILAIAFSFLFAKSPLAIYDLQLAAGLFIVLFLVKRFIKTSRVFEAIIFTVIVFVIVNTTGGLESQFFFLIYFLLFALSLLLEPVEAIIATLTAILFYLIYLPQDNLLANLIPLISLALLTPFAMFMGQEYLQSEKLRSENEAKQENTFLFLSLLIKNHLKNIKQALENFMGDKELGEIKRSTANMEKLIEKFEKEG
jgi:hypothetical protein